MKSEELLNVYDQSYAENYNDRFLFSPLSKPWSEFELSILKKIIQPDSRWLDIGCGTGYFLSLFPGIKRAGLDMSPGMLARAKRENPDALFFKQGDFRMPNPEWNQQWTLVSCMWGAYIYVDSLQEVEQVIRNMIDWTATGGSLFLPIIDIEELRPFSNVTYEENVYDYGGKLIVSGAIWTWVEHGSGNVHSNLISPHTGHFIELLKPWFSKLEVMPYPHHHRASRKCILATGKKSAPDGSEPEIIYHPKPEGAGSASHDPRQPQVFIPNRYIAAEFFRRIFNGEFLKAAVKRVTGKN